MDKNSNYKGIDKNRNYKGLDKVRIGIYQV